MTKDTPTDPARRRALRTSAGGLALFAAALAAGAGVGLAGCQALVPDHIEFSQSELDAMLAKQFPLERRVIEVVDLRLAEPRLVLLPEDNRISLSFDLAADDRLFGGHASAHPDLDAMLRYEPSDHSLRLRDVRVRELALARDANPLHGHAQRIGALAAERLLENLRIWRMSPEQVDRLARLGVEPKAITVRPGGIEIAIGPAGR